MALRNGNDDGTLLFYFANLDVGVMEKEKREASSTVTRRDVTCSRARNCLPLVATVRQLSARFKST